MDAPADLQKFNFIDGLRGWAALGVVAVHSCMVQPPEFLRPLLESGARGVQLFFIISAFTLFYSLSKRSRQDVHPIKSFFLRRFFRVAPLFYLAFFIGLLIGGREPAYFSPNGVSLLGTFFVSVFLNGWNPEWINAIVPGGWTIAVEMNFYLLVPLLFRHVKRVWVALLLIPISLKAGSFVAAFIGKIYRSHYTEGQQWLVDTWQLLSLPGSLYVFFCGIFAYLIWTRARFLFEIFKKQTYSYILYGLVAILIAGFYLNFSMPKVVCILTGIVLVSSACNSSLVTGGLVCFIGKISYSIYLMHGFCLMLISPFKDSGIPWAVFFIVLLSITIPAAFLSYVLIECPFQQFGKKIIYENFK